MKRRAGFIAILLVICLMVPAWPTSAAPVSDVLIYDLKVNQETNPIGIEDSNPEFSWKLQSARRGAAQSEYTITVDEVKVDGTSASVWSKTAQTDDTQNIAYGGTALRPQTIYKWTVSIKDDKGNAAAAEQGTFETGLMNPKDWKSVWKDGAGNVAKFIGANTVSTNTLAITAYQIVADFKVVSGKAIIAAAARDDQNYIGFELDTLGDERTLTIKDYTALAADGLPLTGSVGSATGWVDGVKTIYTADLNTAIPAATAHEWHKIGITINGTRITVTIDGTTVVANQNILTGAPSNTPRRNALNFVGLDGRSGMAIYDNISVINSATAATPVLCKGDFDTFNNNADTNSSLLATLGEVAVSGGKSNTNGLLVNNCFNFINPMPTSTLRKEFSIPTGKTIAKARLYATARGFYDAYINGKPVTDTYLNPNFTDYRLRLLYQTYDVTSLIKPGANAIGSYLNKGYFTGYVGYSGFNRYGDPNVSLLMKLDVFYTDGTKDTVLTDGTWYYTDLSPYTESEVLDGEYYDARFEALLGNWKNPGYNNSTWVTGSSIVKPDPNAKAGLTNGSASFPTPPDEDIAFEISAQIGGLAEVYCELPTINVIDTPDPVNTVIYDLGQNFAGTVRLKVKGTAGQTVRMRFGEMMYKSENSYKAQDDNMTRVSRGNNYANTLYTENLRSARSMAYYTIKQTGVVETYIPEFVFFGYRYVELQGIDKSDVVEVTGLPLVNLTQAQLGGGLETSNPLINQLQSNIIWGQLGNYLMVPTDCPQRNERMGWTGDAQVFAYTAAFNNDIQTFMEKWMQDVRDSQILYNRYGAVPDTAPLGGDNRTDGCAAWGDAGVMVPHSLYLAYGDIDILYDNYTVMTKLVNYEQGYNNTNDTYPGFTNSAMTRRRALKNPLTGVATDPYLQVAQRRGDHLRVDFSTPWDMTATMYSARVADLLSQISQILADNTTNATKKTEYQANVLKYAQVFENVKAAFQAMYLVPQGGFDEADLLPTMKQWADLPEGTLYYYANYAQTPAGANTTNGTYSTGGTRLLYTSGAVNHNPQEGETGYTASYHRIDDTNPNVRASQTAYSLALQFNLLPDWAVKPAVDAMAKDVKDRGDHASVGFQGIATFAPALSDNGYTGLVYDVLENTDYPGWLYSVVNGATTIWERWNSYIADYNGTGIECFNTISMNSFNHYSYGTIGDWMYNTILGISIDQDAPGYKNIILKPVPGGTLTYAKGFHESNFGTIKSDWELNGTIFSYDAEIPANTTATVYLPARAGDVILEGGKDISQAQGVEFVEFKDGSAIYNVVSGSYSFKVYGTQAAGSITTPSSRSFITENTIDPSINIAQVDNAYIYEFSVAFDAAKLQFDSIEGVGQLAGKQLQIIDKRTTATGIDFIIGCKTPVSIGSTPEELFKLHFTKLQNVSKTLVSIGVPKFKIGTTDADDVSCDVTVNMSPQEVMVQIISIKDACDINNDGKVSLADLSLAMKYYGAAQKDAQWTAAAKCDVNGDGIVDMADLILILANES